MLFINKSTCWGGLYQGVERGHVLAVEASGATRRVHLADGEWAIGRVSIVAVEVGRRGSRDRNVFLCLSSP